MAAYVDSHVDIREFIAEVKQRPALYNTIIPEYNDRNLKRKLWEEVCNTIYTPSAWNELTVDEQNNIRKETINRWSSLRGCFRRELNARKLSPVRSAKKKKKKYLYFDSLLFLLPFTEGGNESSLELQNDEKNPKHENIKETIEKKMKLTQDISNIDDEIQVPNEDTHVEKKRNKASSIFDDNDDDEAFLKSLLPSMKQFTHDQKLMLRIELMKTILNFKSQVCNSMEGHGQFNNDKKIEMLEEEMPYSWYSVKDESTSVTNEDDNLEDKEAGEISDR